MKTPPNDKESLLVPISMDSWVVNKATLNNEVLAWYYADYDKLNSFESPIPQPFDIQSHSTPQHGVHLHWALPDALTHSVQQANGSFSFPFVPNRWLVVRFNTTNNQWGMKAWVVQSDHQQNAQNAGSSAFLNPAQASGISNDGSKITVNSTKIGTNFTVEAWQTQGDPGGMLFLQAVGPGNVSFSAYKPFSENVFSFVDNDLPDEKQGGQYRYSYTMVGWYSDPAGDPLNGVTTFSPSIFPSIWKSQADWQAQTPTQRFNAILAALHWGLPAKTDAPATPPSTSLYHSFVADVKWPDGGQSLGNNDLKNVEVAVGNTGVDALSALIQNYAAVESQSDPTNKTAWLSAGNTLSSLIQAAALELLADYDKPGGTALVQQQVEKSWFGSAPGGTVWQVVAITDTTKTFDIADNTLTPEQAARLLEQLNALNQQQQEFDLKQHTLESQQGELYRLWLKLSQASNFGWGEEPTTIPSFEDILQPLLTEKLYPDLVTAVWSMCCAQANAQVALPDPTDPVKANDWAKQQWTFPGNGTLAELGLQLKATLAERYWHPTDPVVLICGAGRAYKHGEDGRFNTDGTLTCRLPGQTISGLAVTGQPTITASALTGVNFNQLATHTAIPSIPALLMEAFFSDPLNATIMANAVSGANSQTLADTITALLANDTSKGTWQGIAPSPLSYALWHPAGSPLFLEWMVHYYPTASQAGDFSLPAWTFDGSNYHWAGVDVDANHLLSFKGRSIVTPFAQNVLYDKLEKYLKASPSVDTDQMEKLLAQVMGWDIIGQTLSGLTDQLITLLSQETFPPPTSQPPVPLPCPAGSKAPPVGDLIQQQYHWMPVLSISARYNIFFPMRGGLVIFPAQSQNGNGGTTPGNLQIVDAFGQTYDLTAPNTPNGFQPFISPSLMSPVGVTIPNQINAPFVLGPRIVQSAQLEMTWLLNGDGGSTVNNPICGWLLPNHLDKSIAIYDSAGILQGELADRWRPRPGPDNGHPAPATPEQIANLTLRNVTSALDAQSANTLSDFMQVVDETLWLVNPLGGRADAFLPTLMGRPLAVAQMQLNLQLRGDPATNQMWNSMLTPDSTIEHFTGVYDTGHIADLAFPVRLGSLELRNDGLLGYFLTGPKGYSTFYTVHNAPNPNDFLKPILKTDSGSPTFQGNLTISLNTPVTVTLLLDPRGCAHAYTGILPVNNLSLDAGLVQDFIRRLLVNFQTGPILADPGSLRTPQPAEKQGEWAWLQNMNQKWEQDAIINVNDAALFPAHPPVLREGWLQLSNLGKKK